MTKNRCAWVNLKNPLYIRYHDKEWGKPTKKDQKLFEMLVLEGAQAGLNWETILNKREGFRKAFKDFDPAAVAKLSDHYLQKQLNNPEIIRNRLKVFSARKNAQIFLDIQQEFGSFSRYLWQYVDKQPIINHWPTLKDVPTTTKISDKLSKDLKKRGMNFVGPTIMYAYMQAVGMVNDHTLDCDWHPDS